MSRYNLEAVVLKSTNYKDSDKIYTLFTRDRGKISARAKGVRKISSRRGGNLDTLNFVAVGISESAGGYKTITEVKTIKSFSKLKKTLKNSVNGYYLLELVYRLIGEEHENNQIFDLLLLTLSELNVSGEDSLTLINAFEIKLMKLLGYDLSLDKCVVCKKTYVSDWVELGFDASLGGIVCQNCKRGEKVADSVINRLRFVRGDFIESMYSKEDLISADALIKSFVRHILEGDIRTTRVFNYVSKSY